MSTRWLVGPLIVLLMCALSGCGGGPKVPPGVVIKGRLLFNGKPMEMVRPDVGLGMIEVTLIPTAAAGAAPEGARADKEGRFEIRGAGIGVPPGSYKLAVRHWKNGLGTKDELEERFTAENTPIVVDVPAKSVGKTHDLGDMELSSYIKPGT